MPKRREEGFRYFLAEHRPEIDKPLLLANLKLVIDLFRTNRYQPHGIGWVEDKKMADSIQIISQYWDLKVDMKTGDMYTNDFFTYYPLSVEVK